MVDRPLTLGAAGGSFSAIVWRLLTETVQSPIPVPVSVECPLCDCPLPTLPSFSWASLDLLSVAVGILVGLSLGPLLDLLILLRASWRWWVRTRLRDLVARQGEWYRLV